MCFTVAVVRHNTLMTLNQYVESLPDYLPKADKLPAFDDFYFVNGFTHPSLPVIRQKDVSMLQWGLVPDWVKDTETANAIRSKTLNAVGETVFEKPSFRKPILSQRGILPVTGFYEWRDFNKFKYPYFIQPQGAHAFPLGVVFDSWIHPETAELLTSFSIITTPANPMMEMIHNTKKRMPLILAEDNLGAWLDPTTGIDDIKEMIQAYPEERMKAYTISRRVNQMRQSHNDPSVFDAVSYPELNQQSLDLF